MLDEIIQFIPSILDTLALGGAAAYFAKTSNSNNKLARSLAKEKSQIEQTSNELLKINEELNQELDNIVLGKINNEHINRAIVQNPNLVNIETLKKLINAVPEETLDKANRARGLTHDFTFVADEKWTFNSGDSYLRTEKCNRCGLIHRYWRGAVEDNKKEGFFINGEKVYGDTVPPCK